MNNVIVWQTDVIAEKDTMADPWSVDEISEKILQSMPQWPRLLKPNEV